MSPDQSSIQHVSDTAFLVAACRAVESARPDALFQDPLARRLAGKKGEVILQNFPNPEMSQWMVAIRTVIIDEFIREAIARGTDVIVNLGAGLDTRPYRLELPATLTWVEVDYADVIAFKEEPLRGEQPRCRLERVALDLANRDERRVFLSTLDARSQRVLVLTEGVIPYLDLDEVGSLADDLRALTRLDSWVVDYLSPGSHDYRQRSGLAEHMRQAPFKFRPADWFGFFREHGWRTEEMCYMAEVAARLGRRAPLPKLARVIGFLIGLVGSAEAQARFRQFAGYARMVPASAENA